MMKFFRRHNKKILGVLMALLMVVFLGGTALESWLRPQPNQVFGESKLGEITLADQQSAKGKTDLLEYAGFGWTKPFPGLKEELTVTDWVLLSREADRLGTRRDLAAVRNIIGDKALAERIDDVARLARIKPDRVVEAIGELQTLQATAGAFAAAALPSEAQVRSAAKLALEKVKVRLVVLTAGMFNDPDRTFTESEIRGHFDKYRDRPAGRGIEFGYRVGDSVQVQYIKIDRNAIAKTVAIPNLETKAKRYFEENKESNPLFRKTPDELEAEKPAPLADDAPAPEISPIKDWEVAKPIAIHMVRNQHADEAALKIADWLILDLTQAWADASVGEDGYRQAPQGSSALEVYAKAIERIPKSLAYPDAVSVATTNFFTAEDASRVPGIGSAAVPEEKGSPFSLSDLSFRTQGLVARVPSGKGINPGDYLATFQTCNLPVKDSQDSLYVFRVVGSRLSHSPETVDEVREKIITDLHTWHGYQEAKARAEGLRSCAPDSSLKQAYESDEELVALRQRPAGWGSGFFEPPATPRTFLAAAARGTREPAVFVQGGVGAVPSEIVDAWFELETRTDHVAIFEVPSRPGVLVVEWIETQRPTATEFTEARERIVQEMLTSRQQSVLNDWLAPDKIRARNQFTPVGGS